MTDDIVQKKPADVDDWPNTVRSNKELDAALKAGREAPRSKLTIPEISARAKARLAPRG